jgi:probable rRNA maturation factor
MPFEIEVQNDLEYPVDAARLVAAAELTLRQQAAEDGAALTIVLTDDEQVRALNQQFRGIDSATDVLSFPADAPPVEIDGEPPYLGDLVIAYPYASQQAAREGHILMESFCLLVVHGVLHLLGHDHDTPERRADMWTAQEAALRALNIPLAIVPQLEAAPHDRPA